jgi:uncharacterized membrane protein YidH (DUF202 family)
VTGLAADPDEDPGLARERTGLAWQRSALALLANAALVLRAGIDLGPLAIGLAVGAVLAYGAFRAWRHGDRLYRRRMEGDLRTDERALTRLSALSVTTAVAALVVIFWP